MIFNYKLFIFDLDGTIIDSEYSHYEAYNMQLTNKISFNEYENIFHDEEKKKLFLSENNICKVTKEKDFIKIYNENAKLIDGFCVFFNELLERGKDIIIITNSSDERISYILSKHPILKNVNKIVSKTNMKNIKPDPECYINIINSCRYNINEIIIFEDSYTGYKALEYIDIEKVFICKSSYYYYNTIKNSNNFENYVDINKLFKPCYDLNLKNKFIDYQDNYIQCILKNQEILFKTYTLLKCIINSNKNYIYLIGIGKSNLIAKKCASTWRSLGISVYSLDCEDIWHGGFGMFTNSTKQNSIIIYLSNSGNTTELIDIANHLKNNFNIMQICITCNRSSKINNFVNYTFNIATNLKENGIIQKAPTISSFMFMNFLDTLGIMLTDNISSKTFTLFHPGGNLGMSYKLDYVVISACGKGSRLKPITNYIPKTLVNIGNDNILIAQIKYWIKYTDNFIIIIEKEYNDIVDFYCKMYDINYYIKNVEIKNNEENAYTLQHALNNFTNIINKRVIITWCDIILTDELDLNKFNENLIFTHGSDSRYYCEPNNLYKRDKGNVIGCYYINNMKNISSNNIKNDICDVFLENFKSFNIYKLNNVIDVGDMNKLDIFFSCNKLKYKTRFFNNIEELKDNKLNKKCIDSYGKDLINIEIKYYKYISKYTLNFPKIFFYGEDNFIMEQMQNCINLYNIELNETIIQMLFNNIKKIHDCKTILVDKIVYDTNLKIEFNDKITKRLNEIKIIINYIKPEKVNNLVINQDINYVITELYEKIYKRLENNKEYHLIHGDCQFSNVLYNTQMNDIFFIDPRGYFGDTLFFGIKEYDYSKILYALSGYDNFNNDDKYYFTFENDNLNTHINHTNLLKFKETFENNNIDFELCFYMMILHWFGLASYNKHNINKCISSYYQGLYLYSILLHREGL